MLLAHPEQEERTARWDAVPEADSSGETTEIRDPEFGFEGVYVASDATIMFRAYDDNRRGVIFTSNPGQTTVGSGVGRERNGVFT